MAKAQEKFDEVLRKMLQTPHAPNVPKRKQDDKKAGRKTGKTKRPAT